MIAPTDAERLAEAERLLADCREQIRSMPLGPEAVARNAFAILRRIEAFQAELARCRREA